MASESLSIERKAIDISGRLGSLYNASYDKFIDYQSVETSKVTKLSGPSICEVFPGDASMDLIDYLKEMDFNDDLRQSILLSMIEASGVSSLVNHNHQIDDSIRFLYYSYRSKEEEMSFEVGKVDEIISPPSSTRATHMITKILWGIEILFVIPIPDHQPPEKIESLLNSISKRLRSNKNTVVLNDDQKRQVSELLNVSVYGSESCIDKKNMSLLTVLNNLKDWQKHDNFHHPLLYVMHPLRWLYNSNRFPETRSVTDPTNTQIIQSFILPVNKSAQLIDKSLEKMKGYSSNPTLDKLQNRFKEGFTALLDKYAKCRKSLKKALSEVRQNVCDSAEINRVLLHPDYSSMKLDFDKFYGSIENIFQKKSFIQRIISDDIEYVTTSDILAHSPESLTFKQIDQIVKSSLEKEHCSVTLWYSNDHLKRRKKEKWEEIYDKLTLKKQQQTRETCIIYVDFSDCRPNLEDFYVVNLPIKSTTDTRLNNPKGQPSPRQSSTETKPPAKRRSSQYSATPEKKASPIIDINALLMGETGVGKSTFINAFINYLMFDTLQQAEQNQPIVLIPVSFLTTVGDEFKEHIVKFGEIDPNEDHEHQGQSVTQSCKSYIFNLNERVRLRLIDTPGMGDTRGLVQDEKNIDHILNYINNLSHLNAVCLLFKPNDSRLNIFFRSCVNQLLTYLTPIFHPNIIFCFTNSRSTFYAPGDTGSLLREMLKQENFTDIRFERKNTFCFDSESFRYLAARKCNVEFKEFVKEESTKSWTISVAESVRLLKCIQQLEPYKLNSWQSLRKASLEISMLARPLMEALRLILYNQVLCEMGDITHRIIIVSNSHSTETCSNCARRRAVEIGPFYIVQYRSSTKNEASHSLCALDERNFLIESEVKHEFVFEKIDLSVDDLQTQFLHLLFECDKLTHFLRVKRLLRSVDPFTSILKRFIEEETQLSQRSNINYDANKKIQKILHSINQIREEHEKQLSKETLSLDQLNKIIDRLKTIPDVKNQIDDINTARRLRMKLNEFSVNLPEIKSKTLSEFIDT